ncbi:uncharacterized protein EKO05_0006942 [Ascochyta rabiei]|uniref:uncharacterized protein n=1 Tax=Didymella rabiei TaxID=5454 RepID=UPI00220EE774|nr:uncharacterized protein EKO05_0006942 [Ascochyta rabiei]UPX16548.1 hypothetical protein EKO05_0006942 [Ascochyta rabiei]
MIVRPLPTFEELEVEKIWLRFPKDIWNEHRPGTHEANTSNPEPKAVLKRKHKPAVIKTEDDATTQASKPSPRQPRRCKVKVARFQYGGPDARMAGRCKNDITLDAPCLQPTCGNCWKWHAQSMRSPPVTSPNPNNKHVPTAPKAWPLSPVIDPRILGDAWQTYPIRGNSTMDLTSSTAPSVHGQGSAPHDTTATSTPSDHNMSLPTSLLQHKAPHASSQTRWRTSPRQRYTAHLSFSTPRGKAKFRALVHGQARKEMRAEHQRLARAARRIVTDTLVPSTDGVRRRSRHRVRLVFRSALGRESYKRLLERDLLQSD